jgi:putative hydrolase of the HAD superfamily
VDVKKKLSAIYFDIDDTLYSTTSFSEKARLNAVKFMIRAGLKISEESCIKSLNEVISEFPKNYEMHFNKLLTRLGEETYKNINPNIIIAAGVVGYHETKHRELIIYEDVDDVLKILSNSSLKMGIITSGLITKQAEKIVRLGVNRYIDNSLVFITDECGYAKTNPKFYELAVKKLNIPATEIMYVGDNPLSDIDTSNAVGMISVLVKRGGKYLNDESKTPPDYIIQNFWELLELVKREFNFKVAK